MCKYTTSFVSLQYPNPKYQTVARSFIEALPEPTIHRARDSIPRMVHSCPSQTYPRKTFAHHRTSPPEPSPLATHPTPPCATDVASFGAEPNMATPDPPSSLQISPAASTSLTMSCTSPGGRSSSCAISMVVRGPAANGFRCERIDDVTQDA